MSANFCHLHVHTEYSLLDGLSKIKKLVARAKEYDLPAVAITDHGAMYGAVEFYKECSKQGIKAIIGMEAYVINGDHTQRAAKGENQHLLLLAKNLEGYKNLMRITTQAHLEGFYYRPRISKEVLARHSSGLICTSACPKGELAQLIESGNKSAAETAIKWYQDVFGPQNYYLEIQRHFYKDYFHSVANQPRVQDKLRQLQTSEDKWVAEIISLSRQLGVPLVATNDAHYIDASDAQAQDALVCISTGKVVNDIDRLRYIDAPTFYLKNPDEMAQIFADVPDAVSNSAAIANQCDLQLELGKSFYPKVDLQNETAPEALRRKAHEGLSQRFETVTPKLKERLDYELDVICTKGYAPYFLILADLANWCTQNGIITNTRGSAAGSLASYVVGITSIDPIRYNLPFERFLNPFRPSSPDIDLDIADDRREELVAHITDKYGADRVAQICTFGKMMARAAVRDVARVLGHPYAVGDRIAKVIPLGSQGFPMSIDRALNESPEFKILYDTDAATKQVVDLARQIEGNARHVSVHAAGVVISPTVMTDFTPLQLEPKGTKVITQYDMHSIADEYGGVGLVKIDVLGIRNLSILGAARDIISNTRGQTINLQTIPLDDKKTYAMLARGETMGTFQLGGTGMTKWLKELKPNRIEDIMVMIALFRPGPMANIPEYIARKNGRSPVTYMHPKMAEFLDKSYGILVYQEDIMFTGMALAGYSWESIDKLRKAIGKKLPKEMAEQHEVFVNGCIQHSGMTKEEAEKIWDLFVPFQGYGFNKAHAASYGVVSYQTSYLKANFPVEYMTALLTAESGNTDKIVEAVEECKRIGIVVLSPDINQSAVGFTIEPHPKSLDNRAIRFGLSAIKNVGEAAISSVLAARSDGPFLSLTDFCLRVDSQKVNRKVLESLIKAGSLDQFGKRSAQLAALDRIRELGTSISKMKSLGQTDLFGGQDSPDVTDHLPDVAEFEKDHKLGLEKELLGFYLTEHPHSEKLAQLKQLVSYSLSQLYTEEVSGKQVITGGIVESVRNVTTKAANQPMCFAVLTDLVRTVEIVVFPKVYAATSSIWQPDNIVQISGKVEARYATEQEEGTESLPEVSIIVDSAAQFIGPDTILPKIANGYSKNGDGAAAVPSGGGPAAPDNPAAKPTPVVIDVPKGLPSSKLVALNSLLQASQGPTPASLTFHHNGSTKTLPLPYGLAWTPSLKADVAALLSGS